MVRTCAAVLAALALAAGAAPLSAAAQTLTWRDAERVAVLCLAAPTRLADYRALQQDLCRRVVADAAADAPLPVAEIAHGDPQAIASDTVTLLVHASVDAGPQDSRLVALSIRPFRATSEQTAQLFGAPPRAALLTADGGELDAAVHAALSQILPWRAPAAPVGAEPLH